MENLNNCSNSNCNIFSGWRTSYIGPPTFDGWNCDPSSFAIFLLVSDSKRTTKVTTKIPIYEQNIQKSSLPTRKGNRFKWVLAGLNRVPRICSSSPLYPSDKIKCRWFRRLSAMPWSSEDDWSSLLEFWAPFLEVLKLNDDRYWNFMCCVV
jgi:hypothetical protein